MPEAITEQQARETGEWPNIWYRSWPNGRDYSFTYALVSGSWRVYINNSPDYRNRSSSSVDTHRLDIGARPYICWNQAINTVSDAQGVSALWADCTERYISTGRFEPPPGRPTPTDKSVLNGFVAPQVGARHVAAAPALASRPHPQPPVFTGGGSARPWHEDHNLRRWGGGLAVLTLFGLFWVICMHNGIGFWDVLWATAAGVGAYVSIRSAAAQPGGRNWPIAYTVAGAILGFVSLAGRAPGALWAVVVLLAIANGAWYAFAAYKHETSH